MASKWLSIRELFSGIIEPFKEFTGEMESLVVCEICGEDRKIMYAAELSWSAIHGSSGMTFNPSCGCKDGNHIKLLPDFDEGWLEITFILDEIYLNEIQIQSAGNLENNRRLKTIKCFGWKTVQRRLANFLQLPFGFEDKRVRDLIET